MGSELTPVYSSTDLASLDRLDEILLTGELNMEIVDDPGEISRGIVAQLLAAGSDAELENFGNAIGWSELEDVPVELHGFRWQTSTFEGEGSPVFFIVSATRLDSGEKVTLTTGSLNVLSALSNMARRGTLVGAVRKLVKSEKPTRAGYRPFWLVTPPEIAEANRIAEETRLASAAEIAEANRIAEETRLASAAEKLAAAK